MDGVGKVFRKQKRVKDSKSAFQMLALSSHFPSVSHSSLHFISN
jgi:hypothetical protein